jgi:curli biogenesis system outer membrane secretion channel CsgG
MINRRLLSAFVGALALTGCATTTNAGSNGLYAEPIGQAPVTPNPTPYSEALVCLASYAHSQGRPSPRIAVGRIADYTGRSSLEGGAAVTQGASLMAMSAFAKAGVNLVERFDTSVSELELRYANNSLIGDESDAGRRQIFAGSIPGSDYHLVGGITELNYNIRSSGVDVLGGDRIDSDPTGVFNRRVWVANVGLDLRLVDTETLEIVDVISYQKQIVGREISAGIFAFWDEAVIDVSAGGRSLEPVQLAVRSVVERAVLEIASELYDVDPARACSFSDPLGGGATNITGGVNVHTAYASGETSNVQARQSVDRGHDRRDDDIRSYLRGRYN